MEAVYRLKPDELNSDFVKTIKKLFKNNEVEITITSSPANKGKEEFLKAIEDVKLRKNIVSFSVDEFEKFSKEISAR
ncbi:MAG: hypothetical protein WCI97_07430 [Bacteroidota bacterium]